MQKSFGKKHDRPDSEKSRSNATKKYDAAGHKHAHFP